MSAGSQRKMDCFIGAYPMAYFMSDAIIYANLSNELARKSITNSIESDIIIICHYLSQRIADHFQMEFLFFTFNPSK